MPHKIQQEITERIQSTYYEMLPDCQRHMEWVYILIFIFIDMEWKDKQFLTEFNLLLIS
jgi:hypothetical protein